MILKHSLVCNHTDLLAKDLSCSMHTGVVINGLPANFRIDLEEIGIIAEFTDSTLSFDVIDTCFAYLSNDISVMLELPFGTKYPPGTMFVEVMSMLIDLSILPPGAYSDEIVSGDDVRWAEYSDLVLEYTKIWLSHPMNDRNVYPISGFFGYMVAEQFGYRPDVISDDDYMDSIFVKKIPLTVMDPLKDKMRSLIYDHFGGKVGFESFAYSLANSIAKKYI